MCPLVVNTVWAERLGGSSEPHTVAQPLFASHHREVRAAPRVHGLPLNKTDTGNGPLRVGFYDAVWPMQL